ncbi:MAG: chromate efflux transporter [Candidatus Binatia bacterium]
MSAVPAVAFAEACRYWVRLGFVNFGGPTGQIAMMHRDLVGERRWISEERFMHALNYCVLLPGPEAQQLAIYVGWLLHGTLGGLVAGIGFVLPSVFILLALSWVYVAYGSVPLVAALFYGLKPAVVAIVLEAVVRIGRRALKTRLLVAVAAASYLGNVVLGIPFPVIVALAGLGGFAIGRVRPALVGVAANGGDSVVLDASPAPTWSRALTIVGVGVALWLAPILALVLWRGPASVFVQEAVFFSRAAMVTFGGAYAVLGYIRDVAVEHYGWLSAGQMMDGLGLAESTPGPLIMVTQFVGFVGAWQHPEGLPPWLAGTIGALITSWVTFVPCFIWIFLGAPYIERLRGNRHLTAALSAVTAAVVGVIVNLAVVFALHTFFPAGRVDLFALVVAAVAFTALQRWHVSMPLVIAVSAGLGVVASVLGGGPL